MNNGTVHTPEKTGEYGAGEAAVRGASAPGKPAGRKHAGMSRRNRNRLIFYCVFLALPVLQFCVFYIGVNFNSILLAFKDYSYEDGSFQWVGFENFSEVFYDFKTLLYMRASVKNSLLLYVFTLLGTVLALFFSYYIYKKAPLSGFYRTILFLPNIISSIVMVLMFKYFVERAIPEIVYMINPDSTFPGLLADPDYVLPTLIFYCVWSGFGTQMLMYTGAMGGISDSVIEAAKLDGVTPLKEFFYIVLPLIYPTVVTFVVVGVSGIFTNQMNLFNFYGLQAEYRYYTFGYYLYRQTQSANISQYPKLAALGLLLTAVAVPLTLLIRKGLEKAGPKA